MAAMHNTSGRYAQFMRRQCTTVAEVAEKIPALTVRSTGSAPPEWWLPHAGHPAPERRNAPYGMPIGSVFTFWQGRATVRAGVILFQFGIAFLARCGIMYVDIVPGYALWAGLNTYRSV